MAQEIARNQALVSIIIPCYNAVRWVGEAIESALAQTYPHVEVIVIDDGSKDGSRDVIQAYETRIRWEANPNQGAPAARNRGLELAQGAYVKFLDADDLLLPDAVARQVEQAGSLPPERKAIVYGDAVWIDSEGKRLKGRLHTPQRQGENSIAYMLYHSPLIACPLYRLEYLSDISGFRLTMPKAQEHDLHLRLVLAGVEFLYFPGPIFCYRQHESSQRIYNQAFVSRDARVHYEIIMRQAELIRSTLGGELPTPIRVALSHRLWGFGRSILREGHKEEAFHYFNAAREMAPEAGVLGKQPYPLFVRLLGPVRAEALIAQFRKLYHLVR